MIQIAPAGFFSFLPAFSQFAKAWEVAQDTLGC
jgi:hypothetical protein